MGDIGKGVANKNSSPPKNIKKCLFFHFYDFVTEPDLLPISLNPAEKSSPGLVLLYLPLAFTFSRSAAPPLPPLLRTWWSGQKSLKGRSRDRASPRSSHSHSLHLEVSTESSASQHSASALPWPRPRPPPPSPCPSRRGSGLNTKLTFVVVTYRTCDNFFCA